jgi:hypothetical protein
MGGEITYLGRVGNRRRFGRKRADNRRIAAGLLLSGMEGWVLKSMSPSGHRESGFSFGDLLGHEFAQVRGLRLRQNSVVGERKS